MAKRKAGKLEAGEMETPSLGIQVFGNAALLQFMIKFLNIADELEVLLVNRAFKRTCDDSGPSNDFVRIAYGPTSTEKNRSVNRHSNVMFNLNCFPKDMKRWKADLSFLAPFSRLRRVELVGCLGEVYPMSSLSKHFQNPHLLTSLHFDGAVFVGTGSFGFPNLKSLHLHSRYGESPKWGSSHVGVALLFQQCSLTRFVLSGVIHGRMLQSILQNLPKTIVEMQLLDCRAYEADFDFSVLLGTPLLPPPLPNLRKVVCTKSGTFHQTMDVVEKKLLALGVEFVFEEDGFSIM